VPLIIEPDPDDTDFASVMVDATIAGRPYRLVLDTGAARTQLDADEYTSGLSPVGEDSSFAAFGGRVTDPVATITDLDVGPLRLAELDVVNSTLRYPVDLILGYPTMRQADWLFDFPAKRWMLTK
jgi:hypothetical protein